MFFFRKREGSVDSVKLTPQMQEMKITLLEQESYELSNKSHDNSAKNVLLDKNLQRFEEERRQFELEKLKFLEDKRELDRLRLKRFERYKRELEAKRLGIKPNYDIDNPNDYMIARKVVIDYNMQQQQQQDSGSESEPDITVVEMTPKKINANMEETEVTEVPKDESEKCQSDDFHDADDGSNSNKAPIDDNAIKERDGPINQNHVNGKELLNGVEKSNDQKEEQQANADVNEKLDTAIVKIEFDEKNPMQLVPFCKLLIHESRIIWQQHKRLHPTQWQRLKSEFKKCMSELLMFTIWCGLGGIILHYVEGNFEMLNKTGVKRVKRDFIDQLWLSSHNLRYMLRMMMYMERKRNFLLL